MIFNDTAARFQHVYWGVSLDTIENCWTSSINIIFSLYHLLVNLELPDKVVQNRINNNSNFNAFEGAMGAMDGTHIKIKVNDELKDKFRNRKGYVSTNVLIFCNFDMLVLYAYVGVEGKAHDGWVLNEIHNKGFQLPAGKFSLNDCGYSLKRGKYLTPYKCVRYHIKEWERAQYDYRNKEEIFNHRHAQLRNVVERFNGVFKQKFKILRDGAMNYNIHRTFKIIYCCIAIHNFIRLTDRSNPELYSDVFEEEDVNENAGENEFRYGRNDEDWRNEIATKMWDEYKRRKNL